MTIITTREELAMYLPSHNIDDITPLYGAFQNSTNDFLREKTGAPLLKLIHDFYDNLAEKAELIPGHFDDRKTPFHTLTTLAQCAVVFNALHRTADIHPLSISNTGINIASSDNYDAAAPSLIKEYKQATNQEAHAAINRLLVQLEEWAEELQQAHPFTFNKQEEIQYAEAEPSLTPDQIQLATILTAWRKSKYFYLVQGLLLNTASALNQYIDIYESRQKFVQLLPDLRFCQEVIIRPEIGSELLDALLNLQQEGALTPSQQQAVCGLQLTLAMHVEARNKMFKRPESKDEARNCLLRTIDYLKAHQDEMPTAITSSPFYIAPESPVETRFIASSADLSDNPNPSPPPFDNNNPQNALFFTGVITQ